MSWNDITLKQFLEIQKLFNKEIGEFEKSKALISIIFDKDINHIPIGEVNDYLLQINSLLESPFEPKNILKAYTINGHKYILNGKIENLSTAQFWDFTEYSKTPSKNIHRMLSCFLVPKGKEYGEGYDIDIVLDDLNYLSIADVNAITFFLLGRLKRLQKTILIYSTLEMTKGMKMRDKMKAIKRLLKVYKDMDSLTMF